eukprot:TRINITY_DN13053_c1_g1_i1.p1 TRINITY_DN13053_c1_g1~~TRINITY_DN13053_c1_g1_i1.p1  ORF type:complete len:251 (-),score=-10.73 TRINITY_DN13053_c1_g1_i1:417-1169(-)
MRTKLTKKQYKSKFLQCVIYKLSNQLINYFIQQNTKLKQYYAPKTKQIFPFQTLNTPIKFSNLVITQKQHIENEKQKPKTRTQQSKKKKQYKQIVTQLKSQAENFYYFTIIGHKIFATSNFCCFAIFFELSKIKFAHQSFFNKFPGESQKINCKNKLLEKNAKILTLKNFLYDDNSQISQILSTVMTKIDFTLIFVQNNRLPHFSIQKYLIYTYIFPDKSPQGSQLKIQASLGAFMQYKNICRNFSSLKL